jgi:peptidoglycan hydrolase FlgJ
MSGVPAFSPLGLPAAVPPPATQPTDAPASASSRGAAATGRSGPIRPQALGAATPDPAKVMKAARDFEAMAIGQLLQPMFDTVDTSHSRFGGGSGEAAWKPMLIQELAKQVENHGGLGLSGPIYTAMLRMQEGQSQQNNSPMRDTSHE